MDSDLSTFLQSNDLLHDDGEITLKLPMQSDVIHQVKYGFYGLCWHHKLEPYSKNIGSKNSFFSWVSSMNFPEEVIDRVIEKNKNKMFGRHIYRKSLVNGLGTTCIDSQLNCVARYSLAFYNNRRRKNTMLYSACLHPEEGHLQEILEESYVRSMLQFDTLDELELLLSAEGFADSMIPICKKPKSLMFTN